MITREPVLGFLTARSSSVDTEIQTQLDLRPYAIMRGERRQRNALRCGCRAGVCC